MPTAASAKLQYEAGQTPVAMSALSDSGDHTIFSGSSSPWSQRSGFAPVIRPDGVITGGAVSIAASGSNDVVDVAAGTCYINGALVTWSASTDESITRAVSTDTHMINSITITSAGAVAVVTGTDGTAFSETRGAAGGPPLIPVTSIEIAQVRTTSYTAAAIAASEIHQVIGTHREVYNYPQYTVDYYSGQVTFVSALPLIHTAAVPKTVYASYASPVFADVPKAKDFKAPGNRYSVSSQQYYSGTLGESSAALNAGGFTAYLEDGVTDGLVTLEGEILWFKFKPDQYKSPYVMSQGKLGIDTAFPADKSISTACTIAAEEAATYVSG